MNAVAQICAKASADAVSSLRRINAIAEALADLMQAAHGGEWRIQVDHDAEFVVIARRKDRRPVRPKRGEAA